MNPEKAPASGAAAAASASPGAVPDDGAGVIVQVALPVPLARSFAYRCSVPLVAGQRVLVPFGRRRLVGIVLPAEEGGDWSAASLREVEQVLDAEPLLHGELLASLRWAAGYYQHPLGEVLQAALPVALRSSRPLPAPELAGLALTPAGRAALQAGSRGPRMDELLQRLAAGSLARDACAASAAVLRKALAQGWVERLALPPQVSPPVPGPALNAAQAEAAQAVIAAFGGFSAFLLDGVTGSGKTEVYLEVIRACIAAGHQALVLVPEIGLTPQTLRRFRERLGLPIPTLHSGLGEIERLRNWLAAARGEAPVVLGTRSAILAPLARPGVLIVDEEHDVSYKQQDGWHYHARDLALVRARALGIPVLLGSATPSLESLANVEAGRYRSLRLAKRAGVARPPAIRIVDLRQQRLEQGFAAASLAAIEACLAADEQVLVFRNRRGYAPVLVCHDCGWRALCPGCERSLTYHRAEQRLRCHRCSVERPMPAGCPACGGRALRPLGAGTERIEDLLAARFPAVPVLRIDRDTTRSRGRREELLERLPERGARILVGTQMLAKGHDLPELTLVVVLGIDGGLYSVDFRATERLGQLLVQVAGRAGRAGQPGQVILQTHDPGHPLLRLLLTRGYHALADKLLAERREAGLPPFAQLAVLRAEASAQRALDDFLADALATAANPGAVSVHGPMPAPLARRDGAWRGQLLLESASRPALQAFLPGWLERVRALPAGRRLRWSIDVDPVDLY